MTREEAIKFLKLDKESRGKCLISDAIDIAIKTLEQETVSKETYDHEYFFSKEFEKKIDELNLLRKKFDELQLQFEEQAVKAKSIINKIRTEIIRIDTELMIPLDRALQVIDKYKEESEDKK